MTAICVHATSISLNGTGVLIRGPSGVGKSSLALQILETTGNGLTAEIIGVDLISDDQTELVLRNGQVFASPPHNIAGLLEIRGQDLLRISHVQDIPLVLVVDLKSAHRIERLPDASQSMTDVLGLKLPLVEIDALHPSAASRLRVAWSRLK